MYHYIFTYLEISNLQCFDRDCPWHPRRQTDFVQPTSHIRELQGPTNRRKMSNLRRAKSPERCNLVFLKKKGEKLDLMASRHVAKYWGSGIV